MAHSWTDAGNHHCLHLSQHRLMYCDALPTCSEDMGGYTYEWTTKIQKYLPTEVAEAIKAMQG